MIKLPLQLREFEVYIESPFTAFKKKLLKIL